MILKKIIQDYNISGLMGFSQGGNVVDIYLSYRNTDNLKCAIIMSGYSLVDANRKLKHIPILNVYSSNDKVVPDKYRPVDYQPCYSLIHDKGHKTPTKNSQIRKMCIFLQKQTYEH
jgi:predicted peptidase